MNKKNLNKAFRELRKEGFIAKQNFMCCQTCAWAAIPEKEKKVVFYHRQDNDTLKSKNSCYIAWKGNGNQIIEIFNKNGVRTHWDGLDSTRIEIFI